MKWALIVRAGTVVVYGKRTRQGIPVLRLCRIPGMGTRVQLAFSRAAQMNRGRSGVE